MVTNNLFEDQSVFKRFVASFVEDIENVHSGYDGMLLNIHSKYIVKRGQFLIRSLLIFLHICGNTSFVFT